MAMHPHLWHIFLNKTARVVRWDGTELRGLHPDAFDLIARELHDLQHRQRSET